MALIKARSRGINLADTFAFSGTVSGAGGGITEADQWRLTTSFSGSSNPISSNWERNDTEFDKIGTGMTNTSGTFSFPSTGIWKIEFTLLASKSSGDSQYNAQKIFLTPDNSNYEERATAYSFINEANSGETYSSSYCQLQFDVTNTTNCKVYFGVVNQQACTFLGSSTANKTTVTFTRLGNT